MFAEQLQNLPSTQVTLKGSETSVDRVASILQYQAVVLLLLNHLPPVVQSSQKVSKLYMGSCSVVKNSDS